MPSVTNRYRGLMVLKKLSRNPAMEAVDLFRRLDTGRSDLLLSEPSRSDTVINEITTALRDALATSSTVDGWRAQSMFASLVAALDECDLMTTVDMGEIYFDGDSVKAPDFFLHLRDGRRLLVDVKNVSQTSSNFDAPITFSQSEVARLSRFANHYGAELHLALFMPGMRSWSLVSMTDLDRGPGGGYRIRPSQALMRSHMSDLGDVMLGTISPLELRVTFPTPVPPAEYSISSIPENSTIEYFVGGQQISVPAEQRLVIFMTLFGGWEVTDSPVAIDGTVGSVSVKATPLEPTGQGFDVVGTLSGMYASYFDSGTRSPRGITALDPMLAPGTLATLLPRDYEPKEVPLWRFIITANTFGRNEMGGAGIEADES